MPLSFLFSRNPLEGLFEKSKNCILTTTTAQGEPHARKVRVATCSQDGSHLWFVLPRRTRVAGDIARNPHVTLSVIDADALRLVHVSGRASVLADRHPPVWLDPDFHQEQALDVRGEDLDITLLRVEVDDSVAPLDLAAETAAAARPGYGLFRVFSTG